MRDDGRRDDDDATRTRTTRLPSASVRASRPRPRRRSAPFPAAPAAPAASGTARFDIRDRLIELDDLRQRGILSEEEFAAKKSELLNRI